MNDTQLFAIIAAPALSIMVVMVGYVVQNIHLNARLNDLTARLTTQIDGLRTELVAIEKIVDVKLEAVRAEMAKNHSEVLMRIAEHEHKHH